MKHFGLEMSLIYGYIWVLAHAEPKNQTRKIFLNIHFETKCLKKSGKKNFELYQVLCIIYCCKMFQYFHTTDAHRKHYSVKIGFISFLSSSDKRKLHHLSDVTLLALILPLSFLSALRFLNLLC